MIDNNKSRRMIEILGIRKWTTEHFLEIEKPTANNV